VKAAALLLDLHRRGVTLDAVGGQLRGRGPHAALTPDVVSAMNTNKAGLLDLVEGRTEPRPSILSLAKAYRQLHGDGFREAFTEVTGCDFWEASPTWAQLYIFEAHLSAGTPGGPEGGRP
jgi:hypothetical protein